VDECKPLAAGDRSDRCDMLVVSTPAGLAATKAAAAKRGVDISANQIMAGGLLRTRTPPTLNHRIESARPCEHSPCR
jgi:hypothetical protein